MVATLSKNTAGTSWSLGNERSYDVWGSVRSGAATGGPKGRYVANLGHVADDESGLIYMRARYYEPESGRFVSEDPALATSNWYAYVGNRPTCLTDTSGKSPNNEQQWALMGLVEAIVGFALAARARTTSTGTAMLIIGAIAMLAYFGGSGIFAESSPFEKFASFNIIYGMLTGGIAFAEWMNSNAPGDAMGSSRSLRREIQGFWEGYGATISLWMALSQMEEAYGS